MKIFFSLALLLLVSFSACKKQTVTPQTITNTVIVHDTTYLIPKNEIIQGTWYCYGYSHYGETTITPYSSDYTVTCTQTTFNFGGSASSASYSSDYSYIYLNGATSISYSVNPYSSTEIRLLAWTAPLPNPDHGSSYYLRRTP